MVRRGDGEERGILVVSTTFSILFINYLPIIFINNNINNNKFKKKNDEMKKKKRYI